MTGFKQFFSNARVFYRLWQTQKLNLEYINILDDGKTVRIYQPKFEGRSEQKTYKEFLTDGVFKDKTQEKIYDTVMEDVLQSVFNGQNAIVVTFGQTGSGKSFTAGGLHLIYQDRGLLPRIVENVFILRDQSPANIEMIIEISYIEILSMTKAHDLLKPYPAKIEKSTMTKDIKKVQVESCWETLQHIFVAEGRKEYTCDTNYPSHIGTSIFTFHFTVRNDDFSDPYEIHSKLHLIDMAGNDIFGDKATNFKLSRQVGIANCTKSYMEFFMKLLSENDSELIRVKGRTNIVSQYLGDTFSRHSILRFVGHLKPQKEDILLSTSLLKFGQVIKNLKPEGAIVVLQDNEKLKENILQKKLDDLLKQRVMSDMLQNQKPKRHTCPHKAEIMERMISDYLQNQLEEVHLVDMGDINDILKIMKNKILTYEVENSDLLKAIEEKKDLIKLEKSDTASSLKTSSSTKIKENEHSTTKDIGKTNTKATQAKHKKESADLEGKGTGKKNRMSVSSLFTKRGGGKKKSGGVESVSSIEKTSKKYHTDYPQSLLSTSSLILPDLVPEHREAFKEYSRSPKHSYQLALESFNKYDSEAKNIYQNYLKELKTLNTSLDLLDLRKNELVQAQLVSQFSKKQVRDNFDNIIKTELEERCEDNLKKGETDVLNQQEVVLNIQAELTLTLRMRQQVREEVKKDFEEFCKEKFTIPVANLEDANDPMFENEVPIEKLCTAGEIIEKPELSGDAVNAKLYETYKELMIIEVKKKAQFLKTSIKWIEYTTTIDR